MYIHRGHGGGFLGLWDTYFSRTLRLPSRLLATYTQREKFTRPLVSRNSSREKSAVRRQNADSRHGIESQEKLHAQRLRGYINFISRVRIPRFEVTCEIRKPFVWESGVETSNFVIWFITRHSTIECRWWIWMIIYGWTLLFGILFAKFERHFKYCCWV